MAGLKRAHRIDTDLQDLGDRKLPHPQRVASSSRGMVATAHYHATESGVEILECGGNAFDAAVAAAFALGVCEPAASGLGGQTMMLLHHAATRKTLALDGSSRAPHRATCESLAKPDLRYGYRASTVPSTPAVLRYVLERYGRLKLADVLMPAIRLAEQGYALSPLQVALTKRELKNLRVGTAGSFFLRRGQRPYPVGSQFKQPVLADTLRRLAKKGVKDFYSGRIARQIEQDMIRNDGLIRRDDLAQVPRPVERRPLTSRFLGSRVFTMPLPGAGRTMIEMLKVYQQLPVRYQDIDTPLGACALAALIRRAFRDRHDHPHDPNLFQQLSNKRMLSDEHAAKVVRQILKRLKTGSDTTHLSVMDREGNAVALTQSIERVYGSYSVTEELGFLYNNYMSSFEYEEISHPYYLRPNSVPWSSVAPTILFRGKKPWLVIGSPGSDRITSSILQVLIRLQTHTPFAAVDAARMHASTNRKVALEATRMPSDIPAALIEHGFELDVRDPYSFYLGCVQLVLREKDRFIGVADPRRDGSAGGPPA